MSGLGTSPRSWRRTGRFPGPTCIDSRRDSSWRHRRSKFRQRPRRALLRRFRPPGPSLRRRYRRLRPGLRPTRSPRRPPEFRRCLPAAPLRPRSRRPIHRRTTPAPVERTPVGAARSSSDFVPSVHSILVARRIRSHQLLRQLHLRLWLSHRFVLSFVGGMTDPPPLPYRFPGYPRRREDARGMSDGQAEGKTSPALVPARDARAIVEAVRVLRAHSLRRGEGAAPGRRPRSCSSLNAGRHDGCIRIEPCG